MSVSGAIDDLGVRLFRRAVESAGHSIHVTDERGVIEYVNPAFEATTGYSATEAVRKTVPADVVGPGRGDGRVTCWPRNGGFPADNRRR
jgi:PAS domain-containing protein